MSHYKCARRTFDTLEAAKVRASSPRGAMVRIGRASGLSWRYVGNDRYDSASGATCAFVSEYDESEHADLRNLNTSLEN